VFQGNDKSAASKPVKKPTAKLPADEGVTILTAGCHFDGKLYCRGSSRIGGKIEGQIVSEGLLIIEEGAAIHAEIKAEEAVIQGQVEGKIDCTNRLELHRTARFSGDIHTPVLIINEGASFNGRAAMPSSADAKDSVVKLGEAKAH
jgi:cytoskeletal protein CcmA (bactofilin family)